MESYEERLVTGIQLGEEREVEPSLRPSKLDEFVGQTRICDNLSVFLRAAQSRKEALDHVLLKGPPGLGKTTLAHIIANELDTTIRVTSGPAIERPADLAGILTNIEAHTVLFIDEVHRLSRPVEEILYPAMEDFRLDIVIGKGPAANTIRLELPPFTIVGATTRAGLLTGPLRDRFGIVHTFEYYAADDLEHIVRRSAKILNIDVGDDAAVEIARRSRGTPRVANRLLRRIRDYAQHLEHPGVRMDTAEYALAQLEIDGRGLDRMDRALLVAIIDKFGGGPVGLETLAAAIGEDAGTIEEVCEPFLLQQGLLQRTPRGRVACEAAYEVIDRKPPKDRSLFDG